MNQTQKLIFETLRLNERLNNDIGQSRDEKEMHQNIERLCSMLSVALDELHELAHNRKSCTGYSCCANCGEIYSCEDTLDKINRIAEVGIYESM